MTVRNAENDIKNPARDDLELACLSSRNGCTSRCSKIHLIVNKWNFSVFGRQKQ